MILVFSYPFYFSASSLDIDVARNCIYFFVSADHPCFNFYLVPFSRYSLTVST